MKLLVHEKVTPSGTVRVSGAKNAATRLMAAAMLSDQPVRLADFPTQLIDARHKARFMQAMGCSVEFSEADSLATLKCDTLSPRALEDYGYPIRTTYLLVAGQLRQAGRAFIPYPGGCKLGERKYDLHLMVWEQFGCQVRETPDCIEVEGRLRGAEIHFPISTVGGTENAILCAAVAEGKSVIHNAYVTPEIENLIELLRLMGASIRVNGTSQIEIEGVPDLRGASIRVIPDRIEAITWMVFAAITGGTLTVENVPFALMEIPLIHLRQAGLRYFANEDSVYISPACLGPNGLQPFELACGTHPGIISDMQPFYVLLALHAAGRSKVFDYRYPERTAYLEELQKYYPQCLAWKSGEITTSGSTQATPASATSTDLRGSMALVMAALTAGAGSCVERVDMALRGYDDLEKKLKILGFKFQTSGDED